MATQTFNVPNISCMHCVKRITQALTGMPGVQNVKADVNTKTVTVSYSGADTLDRVRAKLDEIGYPVAD